MKHDPSITAAAKGAASPEVRRLNPHLFGPVGAMETRQRKQSSAAPLVKKLPARPSGTCSVEVIVTLIVCRNAICDGDNSQSGGTKALRDAIASTLGVDDADPRVRWEYGQAETRGSEGVIVRVEAINSSPEDHKGC